MENKNKRRPCRIRGRKLLLSNSHQQVMLSYASGSKGISDLRPLPCPALISECVAIQHAVSLWSLGSAVLALSPPHCLLGLQRALVLCQHCSAIAKMWMQYQHCSAASAEHSTVWAAGLTPP